MEAHGAAIRRLDEVPPQIPPPGWEASTPIDTLAATLDRWEREIGLERDPEWQRPHVWTDAQRSRWMEHILQGGYGGRSILLSCRGWQGRERRIGPVVLVDGKQRVETVRRFLAGEVAVFGRHLHEFEDHAERRWRRGRSAELTLCMHALETRADVIRWYLQMNGGGTPHAPEEIARMGKVIPGVGGREAALGAAVVAAVVALVLSVYTVPEGHVGVVKRFQKAVGQVDPGIHVKIPLVDSVEEIEVRQRKNTEELQAATRNQLRTQATVSINWTVNREAAMDLFIRYGGLEQFETRILDPKLRSAAKAALARFPADELIRNRQEAVAEIMKEMTESLSGFPVAVNSPQIENIRFPETYMNAVLAKEEAREDAEREKHKLARQKLEAQQAINTAQAQAEAKKLGADAEAYRTETEAAAEAKAIALVNAELARSPAYIELIRAKAWNGVLPQTLLGEGVGAFVQIPRAEAAPKAGTAAGGG